MNRLAEKIARQFDLSHCAFVEIDDNSEIATVNYGWRRHNVPEILGKYRIGEFVSAEFISLQRRGETIAVRDVGNEPTSHAAAFAEFKISSFVSVPLVHEGQWKFAVAFARTTPSDWRRDEIDLMRELAARIWTTVERVRAEEALAKSEEKYRSLFETMDEGFAACRIVREEGGRPVDLLYLELNRAFERQTGMSRERMIGRRMSEIFTQSDVQRWMAFCTEVVETGKPLVIEEYTELLDRWIESSAYPRGADELAFFFRDITPRRQIENAQRESAERQAFLLKLSDTLRAEPDERSIKDQTVLLLGEYLQLDRCYISEVFQAKGYSTVGPEYLRAGISPMSGVYQLSDYPETMRQLATQTMVVHDAANDERFSSSEKKLLANLPQQALLVVALKKGPDGVVWALAGAMATPRSWKQGERLLLEEVAERTWAAVERARTEAALRGSEERFRMLVENVRDYAIFMLDSEGSIVQWTASAERVKGYRAEEVVGKHLRIFFTEDDQRRGEAERELEEARQNGYAERQAWRVTRNGTRIWVDEIATVIRDPDGRVIGFTKISRDLSQTKGVQDLLAESEERYRLAVENVREYGILTFDVHNTITSWNPGAEEIFGLCPEEAIGQPGSLIFTEEDQARGAVEKELEQARQHQRAEDERWHVRKDGSRFFARGVMHAISDESGILRGYVKVLRDETERLQAQEETRRAKEELEVRVAERTAELQTANKELRQQGAERLRLLNEIVTVQEQERARISRELHDHMGQHLTAMLLGLETIREKSVGNVALQEKITSLQELANSLAVEVHDLALELRPPVLDELGLRAALENHLEEWSDQSNIQADLQISLMENMRLSTAVEGTVYRVVQEALTNITRHAGASRASILLEQRKDEIHLIVEDNGNGFDVDTFLRGRNTRRMGLRGMRERIALLNGVFNVESSVGRGTTIFVRIPLHAAEVQE